MIAIETPLGALETGVTVGGATLPAEPCTPEDGVAMTFQNEVVLAVCLVEPHEPELPAGMSILGCGRVRWTIVARADTGPLSVRWLWRPGRLWNDGGANSGQYFDAMTYENDDHVATIATRDGEWLARSAKSGGAVPPRFDDQIDEFYMLQWVNYRTEGLTIDVPQLARRETLTVFFSVAWSDRRPNETEDDGATWFAADLALLW